MTALPSRGPQHPPAWRLSGPVSPSTAYRKPTDTQPPPLTPLVIPSEDPHAGDCARSWVVHHRNACAARFGLDLACLERNAYTGFLYYDPGSRTARRALFYAMVTTADGMGQWADAGQVAAACGVAECTVREALADLSCPLLRKMGY